MWLVNVLSVLISFYLPPSYSVDSAEVSIPNQNQLWMDELNTKMTSASCIDIPQNLSLCRNVGYKKMAFPNLLGHEELGETIRQSVSWVPLLNVECNPDTQLFLCSLFSPVCLEYNQTIQPCRSLCENVKAGCERIMLTYGFKWPDMLRCNKFPANSDLCIPPRPTTTTTHRTCSACRQPKTFEAIIHNYCTSQYAIKGKVLSVKIEGGFKVLYLLKKKKIIKAGVLTKKDRKRLKPYLEGDVNCECDRINDSVGGYFLIMGNKTADGGFTVTYITRWSKDKTFKRAYKNIRKGFECGQDILDLDKTDNKSKNRIIKGKKEDKVGKGNKSGKNKGKDKRKGKKKRRKGKKKKNKRRKGKKNKKRKNRKKGKRGKKQKNKAKGSNRGMVVPVGNNGNNQSTTNGSNKP